MQHRYILEPYKGHTTRHICPKCNTKSVFTLYIDTQTGQPLRADVGRCNREDQCGHHYTPSQYFADNPGTFKTDHTYTPTTRIHHAPPPLTVSKPIDTLSSKYVLNSRGYKSEFIAFLCSLFDRFTIESPTIEVLTERYCLGCTKNREVIFWQIDTQGRVRTGKVMQYNRNTGKRTKDTNKAVDWVHSRMKRSNLIPQSWELSQCLFGEHMLNDCHNSTVCIVESEKSAIIGSGVMPEYIWLATGGKGGLKADMCRNLKGRNVIVYPDLGVFDQWSEKAKAIAREIGFTVQISDILERIATPEQRTQGFDVADYLIAELRAATPVPQPQQKPQPQKRVTPLEHLTTLNPALSNFITKLDLRTA